MQPSFNDFQQNIVSDNSDAFWLVFADYCDENDISHDIREQVNIPHPDLWVYELLPNSRPGYNTNRVGTRNGHGVGYPGDGFFFDGFCVGGMRSNMAGSNVPGGLYQSTVGSKPN